MVVTLSLRQTCSHTSIMKPLKQIFMPFIQVKIFYDLVP